ncbi:hypothetical protein [Kribbella sp. NPDC023855]|uniref:hypothetical protein n=1 Tax=Kribbella sp. NPDC023855 TaxID=3154698 RepID=UPI0033EE3707
MLTRAIAGIGLAVAVLATGGLTTAAVARSQPDSAWSPVAGAPAPLQYEQRSWGDPKTELGMVIQAPNGWKMVKLSTFEVKFTSPDGQRNLRVNGAPKDQPIKTAADAKYAVVSSSTPAFKLISREAGTTRATNPAFAGVVFHHQTLTYTYTDPARGRRLVVDRFVSADDLPHTLFEVSTGGRPQDAAALTAITAKATEDFIRLP